MACVSAGLGNCSRESFCEGRSRSWRVGPRRRLWFAATSNPITRPCCVLCWREPSCGRKRRYEAAFLHTTLHRRRLGVPAKAVKFEARSNFGAVAQLGEHLVCNQGVVGSNPIRSTRVTRYPAAAFLR